MIASLKMINNKKNFEFFKNCFFLEKDNISLNIVLSIFYIIISNFKFIFSKLKLNWEIYIFIKTISNKKSIFLIKKKVAIKVFNFNKKVLVVYITIFYSFNLYNYLFKIILTAFMKVNKDLTIIFIKYANFVFLFLSNFVYSL